MSGFVKDIQYYKFSGYGFFKNLRFFEPFMILYLHGVGISYTQIGTLYALRELISFFMEIPSGIIADRWGRKGALIFCFAGYMVSFLMLYAWPRFMPLLLAFSLLGMADAFKSGTHKAMIMDYLTLKKWRQYKVDYYGHTRGWSQRGSALSSLIAAALVFYSGGYDLIFVYSIIPYFLDMILVWSYPKILNRPLKSRRANTMTLSEFMRELGRTCKNIQVLSIINTSALHTAYLKGIKDFIQPIMAALATGVLWLSAYSEDQRNGVVVGGLYFLVFACTAFASTQSGKWTAAYKGSWSLPRITLFIGLLSGLLAGVWYHYHFLVLSIVFFTLVYMIESVRKPVLTGYVADSVPEEMLTSVISVQSFINTIMAASISFIFGVLADAYGVALALIGVSLTLLIITTMVQRWVKVSFSTSNLAE